MEFMQQPVEAELWSSLIVNEMPRDGANFGVENIVLGDVGFMGDEEKMALALGAAPIQRNVVHVDFEPIAMAGEMGLLRGKRPEWAKKYQQRRKNLRSDALKRKEELLAKAIGDDLTRKYSLRKVRAGRPLSGEDLGKIRHISRILAKKPHLHRHIHAMHGEELGLSFSDFDPSKALKKAGKAIGKGAKAVGKAIKGAPKAVAKTIVASVKAPIKATKFVQKQIVKPVASTIKKEVVSQRKGFQTDISHLKKEIKGAKKVAKREGKGAMALSKDILMAPVGIAKTATQLTETATKGVLKTGETIAKSGGRGLQMVAKSGGKVAVTAVSQAAGAAKTASGQAMTVARKVGDISYEATKVPLVAPLAVVKQMYDRAAGDISPKKPAAKKPAAKKPAPAAAPAEEMPAEPMLTEPPVFDESGAYVDETGAYVYPGGEATVPSTEWDAAAVPVDESGVQYLDASAGLQQPQAQVYAPSGAPVAPQPSYYEEAAYAPQDYQESAAPSYDEAALQYASYQPSYQEPSFQEATAPAYPTFEEAAPMPTYQEGSYVDTAFPEAAEISYDDSGYNTQLFGLGAVIDNEIEINQRQTAEVLIALADAVWPQRKIQLAQQKLALERQAADLAKAKAVMKQANGGINPLKQQPISQLVAAQSEPIFEQIVPTNVEFYPYKIARWRDGDMAGLGANPFSAIKRGIKAAKFVGKAAGKGLKKLQKAHKKSKPRRKIKKAHAKPVKLGKAKGKAKRAPSFEELRRMQSLDVMRQEAGLSGNFGAGALQSVATGAANILATAGKSALQQKVLQDPAVQAQLDAMATQAGSKAAESAKSALVDIYQKNKPLILGGTIGMVALTVFLAYSLLKPRAIKLRLAEQGAY